MNELTHILDRAQKGDPKAAEELLPLVYEELRKLAALKMAQEKPGQTLATALVHEAWLRLAGESGSQFQNRAHFFGAAAEAMRRILIERARRRSAAKRGGGAAPLDVHDVEIATPVADDDALLRLDEALEKLAAFDARKAELVKLRYFVGMSFDEAAARWASPCLRPSSGGPMPAPGSPSKCAVDEKAGWGSERHLVRQKRGEMFLK